MTNCPHCKNAITHVNCVGLDGRSPVMVWKIVSHNCPHCHSSLGMQIDPIAIKTDTIRELKRS